MTAAELGVGHEDLIVADGVSATVALFSLERIGIHVEGSYHGTSQEWSTARATLIEYSPAR
ncbi:MAG: hypothetical protein WAU75_04465 [Solirubrobacteraceae bacterium]